MSPRVPLSQNPGRHERHFVRRLNSRIFPRPLSDYEDEELLEVQRLDHEELLEFLTHLRKLVQRTVDLKPNEESQVILDLKSEFDKAYEKASTLADDQGPNQEAIAQLIGVIMNVVRNSAGNDAMAQQELADEDMARTNHFRLCQHALVADLLDPESLIQEDELIPVLLSADEESFSAALELFDDGQRTALAEAAGVLVRHFDMPDEAWNDRVDMIKPDQ